MSRMAAVDTAIRLQLANDGKKFELSKPVSEQYSTKDELQRFLIGVAHRLKLDEPSLRFDWTSVDPDANLTTTLMVLESLIGDKIKLPEDR